MKTKAFTLIELSIALVIIGLIVGGVLVGKDLIKAAQFRAQISQIEQFTTASNTFKAKYNCLAGDCINATQFGFTGCLGNQTRGLSYNGNGNGNLAGMDLGTPDNSATFTNETKENYNFWYHLNQAGLISETLSPCGGTNNPGPVFRPMSPQAKMGDENARIIAGYVGGYWGAGFINFGNVMVWTQYLDGVGFRPMLIPPDAENIDRKVDDGKPQTGKVHVVAHSVPQSHQCLTFTAENSDNAWCTNGAANIYLPATSGLNDGTLRCSLGFQFRP